VAIALQQLTRVVAQRSVRQSLEIAQATLDSVFEGSLELWRRKGRKDRCFRSLLNHPDLPVSKAALQRAMRILDLVDRLSGISAPKNLHATHLAGVLGLSEELQLELLTEADKHNWSTDRLLEEARKYRVKVTGRGRPRSPRVLKTLGVVERATQNPTSFADRHSLDHLDLEQAQRLHGFIMRLQGRLGDVERLLDRRIRGASLVLPRLLLIDPDATRADAMAATLEQADFSVTTCESVDEATALKHLVFDCAVLANEGEGGANPAEMSAELVELGLASSLVVISSSNDAELLAAVRSAIPPASTTRSATAGDAVVAVA